MDKPATHKPTVAELEAILNDPSTREISIEADGSLIVGKTRDQLQQTIDVLYAFTQELANEPCTYGDNCLDLFKLNHGQCLPCKARAALARATEGE